MEETRSLLWAEAKKRKLRYFVYCTTHPDYRFLFPNDKWLEDQEFQSDCLVFTIFNYRNRISCLEGTNHWIPFSEQEAHAKAKSDSNFMKQFMMGTYRPNGNGTLYED